MNPHYVRTRCTCAHNFFVTQVIEGNLPWHKVVYGGPVDQMLESNQDPILLKIWTGKTKIKHPELAQNAEILGNIKLLGNMAVSRCSRY